MNTMPKLPAWLANTVEKMTSNRIYHVEVIETRMLSASIKQVTFSGDLLNANFTPGLEVSFRVNKNEYRNYTLSGFDAETETCEVIFYLNKKGPGHEFALNLKTGDHLKLIVNKVRLSYNDASDQHFFFGDETSLGLYEYLGKKVLNMNEEYFGILELNEENFNALGGIKLLIDAVPANLASPGENAIIWMENMHPKCWDMWKYATFYLTGNAKSVGQFQKYLQQRGVEEVQMIILPYWEAGKSGVN